MSTDKRLRADLADLANLWDEVAGHMVGIPNIATAFRDHARQVRELLERHAESEAEVFRCICTAQGSAYGSDCPRHDPKVNTADPYWRKRYDDHIAAQKRVRERLGWQ